MRNDGDSKRERASAGPRAGSLAPKLLGLGLSLAVVLGCLELLPRLAPGLMPAKVRSVMRLYDARSTWEDDDARRQTIGVLAQA